MLAEAASRSVTRVGRRWVDDFRCLRGIDLELDPGLTVIHGPNGQGKTSLLEAIAWIASAHSFRGVADAPLVRTGCEQAIVRAEIFDDDRLQLFEAEVRASGRNRIRCNTRAITRARDLHGLLRVAVFAPDDLELVKAGPAARRRMETHNRRPRCAHAGIAGRATHARARVAARRTRGRARAHRHPAGAAPRRRVQRARRAPFERARAAPSARADVADDRGRDP